MHLYVHMLFVVKLEEDGRSTSPATISLRHPKTAHTTDSFKVWTCTLGWGPEPIKVEQCITRILYEHVKMSHGQKSLIQPSRSLTRTLCEPWCIFLATTIYRRISLPQKPSSHSPEQEPGKPSSPKQGAITPRGST